ncbi:DUF305 domain-containing protein [Allorhizocola rhizosphaerae]|uniref:DUF305 domain-containing protein n=1 Tax=Allorhizocola rhizosphaerae TaxID=1872709 RepID=UPI000E3C4797|nr:DUF305 domain-containing protein [Allorhizocola rhizosphaerae]
MNRIRFTVMLSAAVVAALGLSACGHDSMPGMDHGSGNNQPSIPATANFNTADVQFAQMMIPHHAQAVEMAELAASRASDPELKALAATIKGAQQPEIDTMTGWLKSWGQPSAMPGGHNMPGMGTDMPGMMSEEDMNKLKAASGVDFDRQFARMMIAHHNGAIQMARDEIKNGSNPDAKRLAAAIEQSQAAEVAQLQKILDRL